MRIKSIFCAVIGHVLQKNLFFLEKEFPAVQLDILEQLSEEVFYSYDLVIYYNNITDMTKVVPYGRVRAVVYPNDKSVVWGPGIEVLYNNLTDLLKNVIIQIDREPFICSTDLMGKLFPNIDNAEKNNSLMKTSEFCITGDKAGLVLLGKDQLVAKRILDYAHENIVAYYDIQRDVFVDRYGQIDRTAFDSVYIINTLNSPANKSGMEQRFSHYKRIYIGEFGEFEQYEDIYYENECGNFRTPIAMISSFGPEMGKLDVLCELNKQFVDMKIPIAGVSSNPCAMLIPQIKFVEYPKSHEFTSLVRKIRLLMKELDEENKELVFWDIPGGCCEIDNLRTDYGGLTLAFLNALKNIDVVLLCFNNQISIDLIKKQCYVFEAFGVSKVILIQSKSVYLRTMIAEGKLSVYENIKQEKINIDGYEVFSMSDVMEGELCAYLLKLFTNTKEV